MKPSDPAAVLPSLPPGAEILILRLRSLGDVVLTTPALAAVHDWRPDLRLVVLVEPAFAAALEGHPAVAEILLFRDLISAARDLRRRRFPVVFNQHGGPTSALLAAASGSPARVCWAGCQFPFFYNVLVPGPEVFYGRSTVHTVEHRLTQFYWTGLPRGPIPAAKIYPQLDAVVSVERKLARGGVAPGEAYCVLRPGAASPAKRWDVARLTELARWLREEHGLKVVVDVGPGDEEILGAVRQHLGAVNAVFDSLDRRELIGLVASARLFVGNDTGPTHVAAAVGCPVVAIFGASNPAHWRPWSVKHRVVVGDGELGEVRSVTVEKVRMACLALLSSEECAEVSQEQRKRGT